MLSPQLTVAGRDHLNGMTAGVIARKEGTLLVTDKDRPFHATPEEPVVGPRAM